MSLIISTQPTAEPLHIAEVKLHLRIDSSTEDTLLTALTKGAREYCELFQRRAYVMRTYQLRLDNFTNPVGYTMFGGIPVTDIELPYAPLIGVDSVQYVDTDGDTQTLSTDYYTVDTYSTPGRLLLAYGQSWPSTLDMPDAVIITYKAGYLVPTTVNGTSDVWTTTKVYADTNVVRLSHSSGATSCMPTGVAVQTNYYVRDYTALTFKLAASSGGTAIDVGTAGTGNLYFGEMPETIKAAMKLLIGHWYENREDTSPLTIKDVPRAVDSLLWMERVF